MVWQWITADDRASFARINWSIISFISLSAFRYMLIFREKQTSCKRTRKFQLRNITVSCGLCRVFHFMILRLNFLFWKVMVGWALINNFTVLILQSYFQNTETWLFCSVSWWCCTPSRKFLKLPPGGEFIDLSQLRLFAFNLYPLPPQNVYWPSL